MFRLTETSLRPGESLEVKKAYQLVHRSTRRVIAGEYHFELLVNGAALGEARAHVQVDDDQRA